MLEFLQMKLNNSLKIILPGLLILGVILILAFSIRMAFPDTSIIEIILILAVALAIIFLLLFFIRQKKLTDELMTTTKLLKKQQAKGQRDLDMARQIQQSLLGHKTFISPEIKVIATCNPAEKIGGDFYSFEEKNYYSSETSKNKTGIIELKSDAHRMISVCIGDVAGHGIASALIMLLAKSLLEQLIKKYNSAAKILEIANRQIKTHTEQSDISFVTAALLIINLDSKQLLFSKAGHTDPIMLRPDGSSSLLSTEGVFLGMFDSPVYEEKNIQLKTKDKIILYTDGITEAKNEQGEIYGMKRFQAFLEKHANQSLEAILAAIFDEIQSYTNKKETSDDCTLVLIEIL